MSLLDKQLKATKLGVVTINYGGEKIVFDLIKEVRITEETFQAELKKQASKYGFALMVHGKLKTIFEDLKVERRKIRGKLFQEAKEKDGPGGRPLNDEMSKAFVESHPLFIRASKKCIEAKDAADQLYAVVKAFEHRKDLLQTISSNKRNES